MSNNEFHQRRLSATPRGVGVMCNFFAQSAENATLKDVEGNEYIDSAAGIAVLNTGIATLIWSRRWSSNCNSLPTPRIRLCRMKATSPGGENQRPCPGERAGQNRVLHYRRGSGGKRGENGSRPYRTTWRDCV